MLNLRSPAVSPRTNIIIFKTNSRERIMGPLYQTLHHEGNVLSPFGQSAVCNYFPNAQSLKFVKNAIPLQSASIKTQIKASGNIPLLFVYSPNTHIDPTLDVTGSTQLCVPLQFYNNWHQPNSNSSADIYIYIYIHSTREIINTNHNRLEKAKDYTVQTTHIIWSHLESFPITLTGAYRAEYRRFLDGDFSLLQLEP